MNRQLSNVSLGGLCCESNASLEPGTMITVRIRLVDPVFEAEGRVAWCKPRQDDFRIGVEFINSADGYRIRMVEQVCHIEHYRNEMRQREGRVLDWEQAAQEWISKYASTFPTLGYADPG